MWFFCPWKQPFFVVTMTPSEDHIQQILLERVRGKSDSTAWPKAIARGTLLANSHGEVCDMCLAITMVRCGTQLATMTLIDNHGELYIYCHLLLYESACMCMCVELFYFGKSEKRIDGGWSYIQGLFCEATSYFYFRDWLQRLEWHQKTDNNERLRGIMLSLHCYVSKTNLKCIQLLQLYTNWSIQLMQTIDACIVYAHNKSAHKYLQPLKVIHEFW